MDLCYRCGKSLKFYEVCSSYDPTQSEPIVECWNCYFDIDEDDEN